MKSCPLVLIQPHYPVSRIFHSCTPHSVNVVQSHRCSSTVTTDELGGLEGIEEEGKKKAVGLKTQEDRDPKARDPLKQVSLETSMRYLKSEAYKETYGDNNVWVLYRRNFKGQFQPKKTRKSCIRGGKMATGSPCPICRDEYLVLDYRNVDLLKQFISPFNGETLGTAKTGLCQVQHFKLLTAIEKAMDHGTITFDVKFREYDYEQYYSKEVLNNLEEHGHVYY